MTTEKVFVYRNLTKKCLSIKALTGPDKGTVIGYSDFLKMKNCEFHVNEKGRLRVIRTGHKNVHAGVVGYLCDDAIGALCESVTYNPRKYNSFVTHSGKPIHNADFVSLEWSGKIHTFDAIIGG